LQLKHDVLLFKPLQKEFETMNRLFIKFTISLIFAISNIVAQNNSQFILQTVPSGIEAGQQFDITITFENTGTTTWTDAELYHLGSQNPQDNLNWGPNRLLLPNDVLPGEQVTLSATLTAPSTVGLYYFQWQMVQDGVEWFGEKTETVNFVVNVELTDSLFSGDEGFSVSSHIVSSSFFTWFTIDDGQQNSPWIPLEGRESWTGGVYFWKEFIKQVMAANIDVLYVELIPYMENQRGNLFMALYLLRSEGWDVPKVCPFLDPEITYSILGYNGNCATEEGKDELIGHYIRFYNQYFSVNTDAYADDFIYTQDGSPVLDIWHIQLHINYYNQLTRDDVTSRLSSAFGSEHPIFNNDIKMINNAYSPAFSFADERIYQFEMQQYKIDKNWNGINSSLLKPGYWDQNVRNPGYLLPRDGGSHYSESWELVNNDPTIDRVYIESFNEYDEGSGIYAARTDTIYKKTDGGMNNTGNDVWSSTDNPFEYINTTAAGAAQFNDDPQLDAKILWDNIPVTLAPGETVSANIIVRNEGNEKWNATDNFKLGQNETIDTIWFGPGRYLLNDTLDDIPLFGGIFRGRVKIFDMEITAPENPGTYLTHWQMLQEGNVWFGDTLEVEITVGQEASINSPENKSFEIYPNPSSNLIVLTSIQSENIRIYDCNGKIVKNRQCNKNQESIKIDISDLNKGLYFIKAGKRVKKFIKQ
jgi:hypothetical protein